MATRATMAEVMGSTSLSFTPERCQIYAQNCLFSLRVRIVENIASPIPETVPSVFWLPGFPARILFLGPSGHPPAEDPQGSLVLLG